MARGGKGKGSGLSGQALKDYRHKLSILKKKGLVSAKIDARSHRGTKYMRAKLRKNEDVLEGRAVAVKASKEVRKAYSEAGVFEARGQRLIVPKEHADQRTKISKGKFVQIETPVPGSTKPAGTRPRIKRVVFPANVKSLTDVLEFLRRNADRIDDGLTGSEQFAFKLFGHTSLDFFPEVQGPYGMIQYIEKRYQHLLKNNKNDRAAYSRFEMITFNTPMAPPQSWQDAGEKEYSEAGEGRRPIVRKVDATGRNSGRRKSVSAKVRKREADAQALAEWQETQRDRKARNAAVKRAKQSAERKAQINREQRERSRRNRRGEYTKKGK